MKKEEYLSQIDEVIAQGPYTDTWDSLCEHPTPKWYARDKFATANKPTLLPYIHEIFLYKHLNYNTPDTVFPH